jgi:predicted regulator of Ras-like GTPase activity (Roadblock/LC7/MglB family)
MLGLFKRMLSKQEAPERTPVVKAAPVARPAPPLPKPVPRTVPSAPASAAASAVPALPKPIAKPVATSAQPRVAAAPSSSANGHVKVALAVIAASLPESISHKVPANPDQFVSIPVDRILSQLAHGQVVMTTAELRECAPDYFSALAGHDDVPVTLPLGEIVKQLSPEHFIRRPQRRVNVPVEVTPVFNSSSGAKITPPVASASVPVQRVQPSLTSTMPSPAPTPAAATPVAATSAGKIAMSPQALAALSSAAAPSASRPAVAVSQKTNLPPPAAAQPLPRIPATSKKTATAAPKITGEIAVPLQAVCEGWVDEVRAQLVDVDVAACQIIVPLEFLEPAMKSGRILFSWQEVAGWIQPPLTIPPTPKVGEMAVELPLKVLAPLFMAYHRNGGGKRVEVDETIPDLFGGGNGKSAAPVASTPPARQATTATKPAPAAAAVCRAASVPVAPKAETAAPTPAANAPAPETSIEQIIGNASGKFSAKEIVAKTAQLPGITGVLLVMSDGLLVTSQTPSHVKAETIAAFLPQMFGRMNQYTKELALGPLEHLTLGIESGQWHVIKCVNIYFAVLGNPGETFPLNLLAQVAAELSSQSK